MTEAIIKPLRFGSKNPSKKEQKQIEKAVLEAWKARNKAPDIKPNIDLDTLMGNKLSKEEIRKICGL